MNDQPQVPSVDLSNNLLSPVPWVPTFGKAEIQGKTYWTMTIRTPDTTLTVMCTKEHADQFANLAKQSVLLASPLIVPDNAAALFNGFQKGKGTNGNVHGQ